MIFFPADQFEAMRLRNIQTVREWVRAASADLLDARYHDGSFGGFALFRPDGATLAGYDRDVTGLGVEIEISSVRPIDRRSKTTARQVRDAVRKFLVRHYEGEVPDAAYFALSNFEYRLKIRA